MSRLPIEAASRNMSACSAQAMSQVGCRLMVASSAKISRPLASAEWGDMARALATKAAMSSVVDGLVCGRDSARPALVSEVALAELVLDGSPDMGARKLPR